MSNSLDLDQDLYSVGSKLFDQVNGVARKLQKLRMSKGDYWIKQ